MAAEQQLQTKVIKDLRAMGAWVMKIQAGSGVPQGTADLFFAREGFYGFLELKATKNSKKQPHQQEFIDKMDDWSYARFVWGGKDSNWPEVKAELKEMLR